MNTMNENTAAAITEWSLKHPFPAKIISFLRLWFVISLLYGMFAVCPCCGQSACPVGIGAAGIVGMFFTLSFHLWQKANFFFRKKILKSKKEINKDPEVL